MPDHDALEVQVTALLLGELPTAEAASLHARIDADPALRTLHDRLRIAIELTREATRPPQAKELPRPDAPRLDPARRDQLLAKLRAPAIPPQPDIIPLPSAAPTPKVSPTAGSAARRSSNRREWLAMAAMLVVLLATAAGVQLFSPERRGLYANAAVDARANTEWFESSRDFSTTAPGEGAELGRATVSLSDASVPPASKPAGPTPAAEPAPAPAAPAPENAVRSYRFALANGTVEADATLSRSKAKEDRLDTRGEKAGAVDGLAQTELKLLSVVEGRDKAPILAEAAGKKFTDPAPTSLPVNTGGTPVLGDLPAVGALFGKGAARGGRGIADGEADTNGDALEDLSSVNGRTSERFQFTDQEVDGKKGIKEQPVATFSGFTSGGAGGFGGGGGNRQSDLATPQFGNGLGGTLAQVDSTREMQPPPAKPSSQLRSEAVREQVEEFMAEPMNRSDKQARLSKNLVSGNGPSQPPTAGTHEQNGQILFELGNMEGAAAEFKEATKINPESRTAQHYLAATEERLQSRAAAKRELASRGSLGEAETQWAAKLPKANPDANAPAARRDSDDFGTIAPPNRPAKLPVLRESLDDNTVVESTNWTAPTRLQQFFNDIGQVQERELRNAELGQKAESTALYYARKPTPESLDALELFTTEGEQPTSTGVASAQKAAVVAKDKTLGDLVVQESAGEKLSLVSAKTKADANVDFDSDRPVAPPTPPAPVPQPEVQTATDPFSTFSLNVSDVSFQLAGASLDQGALPAPGSIRTEEFINAFNYHDPMPVGTAPVAFAWERSRDAFAHNRDLLRFSIKTAATGREATKPLNLVLLVDNSGSMERADRVRIRHECLRILAAQLQPQDRISVVTFARTARLAADGIPGNQAGALADQIGSLTPEGGTHLEGALDLAYQTARRHFSPTGINRVVLLTDGAANLGDVSPDSLRSRVEDNRRQGVALDCFGIGWEGLNDDLLENLSRNGDGRYGFINTPEAATANFASQLAGALQVAASDVKVQVEFNPLRVTTHRQVGYARHQLKKEQFRDNTVDAAELAAAEAGNALYVVQSNPAGSGPIATVRVRFKVPGTADYREMSWEVPYEGSARALDQSSPSIRLAAVASNFAEWLAQSPHAAEVTPDRLLPLLNGIPQSQPGDPRPARLESMIRQARSLGGR
jgi:Mg-chelatase subunit ChlD